MSGLVLMRHPAPGGPKGLCYGRTCPGLAPGWEGVLDAAATGLPPIGRVISSPAPRCLSAGRRLAAAHGLPLLEDVRLRELDFGRWEGLPWSQIDRTESDPWAEDPVLRAPPEGERFADLAARVAAAAADLVALTHAPALRGAHFEDVAGHMTGHMTENMTENVAGGLAGALPRTLVVTHAGPIRALWMAREGLSFAEAFARPVPFAVPIPLG